MQRAFRYAWPSSAIDADLMRRLFMARESSPEPTTITRLIAEAVRAQYGHPAAQPEQVTQPEYKPRLIAAA